MYLNDVKRIGKPGGDAEVKTANQAQELTAQIAASLKQLSEETDRAKQSEVFRAWLLAISRFHNYSYGNQILIWSQRPDATRVAGFHTWKQLGRSVKKGEKAIRILAPITRKWDEERDGESMKVSRVLGFRCVSVFDYAQTEGKDMAELPCTATTGGDELLPALERAAQDLGITLVYNAIPGGAKGLSKGGRIEIEETLDTPARCGVIAHELAHEILQHRAKRSETTKQQRELEAESVAFAVLAHFGMRLESRFYLASYEITGDMLTASIETINRAARALIQAVERTDHAPIGE